MADEYLLWLGSRTNKHGVPYAKGTLGAYRDGVVALDSWMTREAWTATSRRVTPPCSTGSSQTIGASTARAG